MTISTKAKATIKRQAYPGKTIPETSSNGEQPIALQTKSTHSHINRSNNDDSSSSSSAIQQATKKLKNAKDQSSNEEDMDTDVSTNIVEDEMHAEVKVENNNASHESDEQQNDGFTIKKSRRQRQRTSSDTQEGHPSAAPNKPQITRLLQ